VEREVVVELGVPLRERLVLGLQMADEVERCTHGASVGVSGLEGGSGMPIKVGVFILSIWDGKLVVEFCLLEYVVGR
jgi:hypothetical protein